MKTPKITSTAAVLALVAAMLATGVVVAGAHGGGPTRGVIHACVDDGTGALVIVGGNDDCGPGASPLDWSGKGPRGAQGAPGPQGESGETNIEVVTASSGVLYDPTTQVDLADLGVGVDCPGDAIATGGGGEGTWEPIEMSDGPSLVYEELAPLVATYPLEDDSLTNPAETGDEATGWFAAPGDAFQGPGAWSVTVWALCANVEPGEDD
ncbi:MAG TPA: hypothetical protein VFK59_10735 [Actinomycetota bacterium]|nr:hypothetical protein [Actinomycetota bacterium]